MFSFEGYYKLSIVVLYLGEFLLLLFRIMVGGAGPRAVVPVVKVGGWRLLLCVGDTRQAPRPVGVWGNLTWGLVPPALWVVREPD